MWSPWAIPAWAAQSATVVFAVVLAWGLCRLSWCLPRAIDAALPATIDRSHRLRRLGLLAAGPAAAVAATHVFGTTPAAVAAVAFVLILLALAWMDAETGLLPDALTLPLLWLGLLVNLRGTFVPLDAAVLGAVAGYLVLWCVYWSFRVCTGREGLGRGDFKLLAAVGAWLGWFALPSILLGAAVLGLSAATWLRITGRMQRGDPLSFGPYLSLAAIVMLLRLGV